MNDRASVDRISLGTARAFLTSVRLIVCLLVGSCIGAAVYLIATHIGAYLGALAYIVAFAFLVALIVKLYIAAEERVEASRDSHRSFLVTYAHYDELVAYNRLPEGERVRTERPKTHQLTVDGYSFDEATREAERRAPVRIVIVQIDSAGQGASAPMGVRPDPAHPV